MGQQDEQQETNPEKLLKNLIETGKMQFALEEREKMKAIQEKHKLHKLLMKQQNLKKKSKSKRK